MRHRRRTGTLSLNLPAASATGVISTPTPAPTSPNYQPIPVLLKADGLTDDSPALQAALDAATSGQNLVLPDGTIRLSAMPRFYNKSNISVSGAGQDLTILAMDDPANSAFTVYQSGLVSFYDFQVYSHNSTSRIDTGNSRGMYVTTSSNVTLTRMKFRKTAGAGVAFWNVVGGGISDSVGQDNYADSFHLTGNTSGITLQSLLTTGCGDDSISVIGYGSEDPHDITILDTVSKDGWWGSGIGIEGARNVRIERAKVYRSGHAGIRIASNSQYGSHACQDVSVLDAYLEGCVTRPELIDAGGSIMAYTNYQPLSGISFDRTTISDPASHFAAFAYGQDAVNDIGLSIVDTTISDPNHHMTSSRYIGAYVNLVWTNNTYNSTLAT